MGVSRDHVVYVVIVSVMTVVVILAQGEKRKPPSITLSSNSLEVTTKKGDNVVLICTADGIPTPTLQWYYESALVTVQNPKGGRAKSDGGQLEITEITEDEQGDYYCEASNTFITPEVTIIPVSISPTVHVILSYLRDWPRTPNNRTETGSEQSYLKLACDQNRPKYSGPVRLTWFFKAGGTEEQNPIPMDERMFVDQQGTLHFSSLQLNDATTDKFYACSMSNSDKIVTGTKVALEVTPVSGVQEVSAELQYSSATAGSQALTFIRGTDAILECFFSGYPTPVMVWHDEDQEIQDQGPEGHFELREGKRQLVIHNVKEEDEATYYCGVQEGEKKKQGILQLNVTSPPIWVESLQSQTVPEGRAAVFHCQTRSMHGEWPPERPLWQINGKTLQTAGGDESKHVVSDNGQTLTVNNVRKNWDIACYQCHVSNSVGHVFGDACLNVILPIQIVTRPSPEQTISRGDVVSLTVSATSDPLYPPLYQWIFRNVTYNQGAPPHVTYDPQSRAAFINTSHLSDEGLRNITGVYICRVYHSFDAVNVTIHVQLASDETAAAVFPFWIIGLIIGLLLLLIIIIIICCVCCRRKMQEGDYPVDKKETAAGLDPEKELKDSEFHDLSRAEDPNQNSKPRNLDLADESDRDDESFGGTEYGDDPMAFNEDGSFIGQYQPKAKQPRSDHIPQSKYGQDNNAYQSGDNQANPPTYPGDNRAYPPTYPGDREAYQPSYPRDSQTYQPNNASLSFQQPQDNRAFNPNESAV